MLKFYAKKGVPLWEPLLGLSVIVVWTTSLAVGYLSAANLLPLDDLSRVLGIIFPE